jgi:hypothetical protein
MTINLFGLPFSFSQHVPTKHYKSMDVCIPITNLCIKPFALYQNIDSSFAKLYFMANESITFYGKRNYNQMTNETIIL